MAVTLDGTKRRYWTTVEMSKLRALYSHTSNPELGLALGRTGPAVMMMAGKLGLRKSPAFMVGPVVRWQRGHRPWNAGKNYEAGGRAKLTQFKKGHRGARQRPVGSERLTRDGIDVKSAEPNVWTPVARFVWQQHFGEIPAGHIVVFKAGVNKAWETRPVIGSLECISRAEHVRRNWRPRGPAKRQAVVWIAPLRLAA